MASPAQNPSRSATASSRRKAILDLAPLEIDCMNALWPLEEATVRDVQQALSGSRPRAYTTIMTILDRLAHKGIVTRKKVGRAYLYRANLQPDVARDAAVDRVVAAFFGGSRQALAKHIGAPVVQIHRAPQQLERTTPRSVEIFSARKAEIQETELAAPNLDETLL